MELGFSVARGIDAVEFVTVVAALIDSVASLRHWNTAAVSAAELGWQAFVEGAVVHCFVAVVRAVALTVANKPFTLTSLIRFYFHFR